ncbi:hypothetical protein BKH19_12940 [Actinomyces oris]|nr:hypothetical protein BKH19_12940 [Actinomyces oris]
MKDPRTNSDPAFRIYPAEQGVAIIRAIAEHRWPMHLSEAFALRDQFGWRPAPDDGTIFTTPVSSGEEDGFIGLDVTNKTLVSIIDFRLSSRLPQDAQPEIQATIQNTYASYISAFNSLYGAGDSESDQDVAIMQWYLPSRASVAIAATRRFLSATVESPATTDLAEAQQRYFDEGGEM